MQPGGGDCEGEGTQSQYEEMASSTVVTAINHMGQQPVEAASPISSRPPASNLDELMGLSAACGDKDEGDRAGGVSGGNRWPRQETLALLKLRSEMDAAFRDATVKGPLWEDVSRKLAEQGYKRSAKKCNEKFENVRKYYKRTKEGQAGRQDGKSYKFFSQLEALHSSTATTSYLSASQSMPVTTVTNTSYNVTLDVAPVSIGIPMPHSSVRIPTSTIAASAPMFHHSLSATTPASAAGNVPASATVPVPLTTVTAATTKTPIGINLSSNGSSSPETEDDDNDDEEGQPLNAAGTSRKRKRKSSSSTHRMMEFFEGLMEQVMQKQEAMQQRFLEVIEKRAQDRVSREEAWKRQDMARMAREHELKAQERAISVSRNTAIINFLQKATDQTIQLPSAASIPAVSAPARPQTASQPVAIPAPTTAQPHMVPPERRDQQPHHHHRNQQQQQFQTIGEAVTHQPSTVSTPMPSEVVMAIPDKKIPPSHQEIGSGGNFEPASSRWPKVEVLALIKLRSGLEHRYQEAGPKGPLWEEISTGMQRMGYNRSAKRCKEKWENINKYFKKVKQSNKKRPEDAKTCPYFHELDALHRKKILGSTSDGTSTSTSSFTSQNRAEERQPQQHQQDKPVTNPQESSTVSAIMPAPQLTEAFDSENKNAGCVNVQASNIGLPGSLFGEGNEGASKKPEDVVKDLMNQQGMQQQPPPASIVDDFDKIEGSNMGSESEIMEYEDDEESEEERKNMAYEVMFQRQNTNANSSTGAGNGALPFLAMVQ